LPRGYEQLEEQPPRLGTHPSYQNLGEGARCHLLVGDGHPSGLRLWLGGLVTAYRNQHLIRTVSALVRYLGSPLRPLEGIHLVQVVKRYVRRWVVGIERWIVQGRNRPSSGWCNDAAVCDVRPPSRLRLQTPHCLWRNAYGTKFRTRYSFQNDADGLPNYLIVFLLFNRLA
jgi:hypothetical protein